MFELLPPVLFPLFTLGDGVVIVAASVVVVVIPPPPDFVSSFVVPVGSMDCVLVYVPVPPGSCVLVVTAELSKLV